MLQSLLNTFSDSTFYFVLGATGTALFTIRAILMLVFGLDHGGRVSITLPARGRGGGQDKLKVDGGPPGMPAVSEGEAIHSFAAVKVLAVKDDNQTLIVAPV